jgi:uncharacterized SAM-binding protein YcdF (DUF218 family)
LFFFFAKVLGFTVHLPHLLLEAALFGLVLSKWGRWKTFGRRFMEVSLVIFAACAFLPVFALLARPLEERFPQPDLKTPPTGIIVLGGAVEEGITYRRNLPALNDAAERMTESAALARRFPNARLIFSGGSAVFTTSHISEAEVARRLWLSLGVPESRIEFEDKSRDTWENAIFTRDIAKPKPGETWLLVTSAMHMPRSVGIFRKIGFPVVAYPVDYRTGGGPGDFIGFRRIGQSLMNLDQVSHEWFGLLAYYVTGRSSELLPGPESAQSALAAPSR